MVLVRGCPGVFTGGIGISGSAILLLRFLLAIFPYLLIALILKGESSSFKVGECNDIVSRNISYFVPHISSSVVCPD